MTRSLQRQASRPGAACGQDGLLARNRLGGQFEHALGGSLVACCLHVTRDRAHGFGALPRHFTDDARICGFGGDGIGRLQGVQEALLGGCALTATCLALYNLDAAVTRD